MYLQTYEQLQTYVQQYNLNRRKIGNKFIINNNNNNSE